MMNTSSYDTSLASDSYTDLSNIQSIRQLGDKGKALDEISRQFESMLVRMMMKSMRDANDVFSKDSLLSSNEGKFYEGMMDDQLALTLSKGRGIGIAEIMSQQLGQRYNADASKTPSVTDKPDYSVKDIPVSHRDPASFIPKHNQTKSVTDTAQLSANKQVISFDGTPEQFIDQLYGYAKNAAKQLGIEPKVLIAQAGLETGWGAKISKQGEKSSFNMFNIKADNRWAGDLVKAPTVEYQQGIAVREYASFRAYKTPAESFNDYANFIMNSPRYSDALKAESSESYIQDLSDAGYATDPNYAEKIMRIVNSDLLQNAVTKSTQQPAQDRG